MHIAIDAHMVGERETGNETYTLNLVRALLHKAQQGGVGAEARPPDSTVSFSLLTTHPQRLQATLPALPTAAQIVAMRPSNAILRIPLTMPWLAARRGFDLLHVTYNAPPLSPCPTVVTIHDISFEYYPQFFSPRDRLILKLLTPLSARRATCIITGSRHARSEIAARYRIPAAKIAVIPYAAGEQFRPVQDAAALQAVRRKYSLGDRPFLLALGNLQPRKNIRRLVEAYASVVRSLGEFQIGQVAGRRWQMANGEWPSDPLSSDPPTSDPLSPDLSPPPSLVIAGQAQWRQSQVHRAVADAGLAGHVLFPGYVADADLPALYSAATLFVYPSLYEGFGLPPLEAMACGAPVVCANVASLPEVVGDAALTVDPTDTEALAQALLDVLTAAGLRADLRARGLRRAAQFSWARGAAETLALYRQALARRR